MRVCKTLLLDVEAPEAHQNDHSSVYLHSADLHLILYVRIQHGGGFIENLKNYKIGGGCLHGDERLHRTIQLLGSIEKTDCTWLSFEFIVSLTYLVESFSSPPSSVPSLQCQSFAFPNLIFLCLSRKKKVLATVTTMLHFYLNLQNMHGSACTTFSISHTAASVVLQDKVTQLISKLDSYLHRQEGNPPFESTASK